ncbi:MAG: hypothetical protein AVO33_02170 [delta proteobacterium ML8_F1]|nr:MAG: hypothetical protein AVO33_02170 [delta proteobacterium ML8_F1]
MAFNGSSTGIYHLVLGAVKPKQLFLAREDYKELMKILKLYKERMGVKLLGYAFTPQVIHLVVQWEGNDPREFAAMIKRTYGDYVFRRYASREVFHHQCRIEPVEFYRDFVELYKYLHKRGINSLKRFERYEENKRDPYLDAEYVLSAFGNSRLKGREELKRISLMENEQEYGVRFKALEHFAEDKKTLRIRRARAFLREYLEENDLDSEVLELEDFRNEKLRLIQAYREKTDLSFRDIGQILGTSHTTVIRLYKEANERNIRRPVRHHRHEPAPGYGAGEALSSLPGALGYSHS